MIGAFVQLNPGNPTHHKVRDFPLGYVVLGNGCWEWVGARHSAGYGVTTAKDVHGRSYTEYAHRFMYERAHGPIPTGLEIDHLCRNRLCVRPDHLEAVTHRVNVHRGMVGETMNRTHCKYGHPLTGNNVYPKKRPDGRVRRDCRACARVREKEKYRTDASFRMWRIQAERNRKARIRAGVREELA